MSQYYDLNNTGAEVQERLDQVMPNKEAISQETEERVNEDNALEEKLKQYTDKETTRAEGAEKELSDEQERIKKSIEEIAVSGGASVANAVVYDNQKSGIEALTVQEAIDFLAERADELGVYEESPEFVRAVVDKEGRLLFGIKTDGSIEWGAGVPTPVKEYIDKQVNAIIGVDDITEKIDSLKEVFEFLDNYKNSESLQRLLAVMNEKIENATETANRNSESIKKIEEGANNLSGEKVDKEEGKSLIDSDYAEGISYEENPEFVKVVADSEGKVLCGIKKDGSPYFPQNEMYYVESNPEWLAVWTDNTNKIIFGFRKDGSVYVGDSDFLDTIKEVKALLDSIGVENIDFEALTVFSSEDNTEWMKVELDADGKVLSGTRTNGSHYIRNVESETLPTVFSEINDVENRTEVTLDADGKILSYRDKYGTKVETSLKVENLILSEEAKRNLEETLDIKNSNVSNYKSPHLPKYGTVNIKQETFYLTADSRYSDKNDIVLIQDLEDTDDNAAKKLTIAHFYIKSTLTKTSDGYSVNGGSVKLDFYAASLVTNVNNKYYVTSTLNEGVPNETSIEVKQITDIPPYKAWAVDKTTEHHCIVDVDFGYYLKKTNIPIGIKYQGSSTLEKRKRNFRFTFYKDNAYSKKDKLKIGELIRVSGFNLKADWSDNSRVKELMLYRIMIDVWKTRPIVDRFPWDVDFGYYTGATGFINGFKISTYVGGEFYGIHTFGLKKDEKNYMLDGTDESGIVVCGTQRDEDNWINAKASDWDDEMMDEMSESTKNALNNFFDFINNRLPEEPFNTTNIPNRMDVQGWIDYFICMQVFLMWDSICRNMILHTRSDKKKFYPYFYDLDLSLNNSYDSDIFDIAYDTINGQKRMNDMSLWANIRDLYWDEIVNRYCELRNTVLNIEHIKLIVNDITKELPDSDYSMENNRWGKLTSKATINNNLSLLNDRFEWLDKTYFIV